MRPLAEFIALSTLAGGVSMVVSTAIDMAGQAMPWTDSLKWALPALVAGLRLAAVSTIALVTVGAVIGHFYNRWALRQAHPEFAERMGVLMATGFIVGESLFGVAFAGIVAATDSDAPLAVVAENPWGPSLSVILVAAVIGGLYARLKSSAARPLS